MESPRSTITSNIKRKNNMKAIVWSKDQCPYCDQAKALLKQRGIEYEERNISQEWTKEQLLEAVPTARTVPQVFLGEEYVGGFMELRRKLSQGQTCN
jgi:glutaredoxin 3